MSKYVSIFDSSRNPEVGEIVLFHHKTDGVTYPAIVSTVRANYGGIHATPYNHTTEDLEGLEATADVWFQAQLTVFRPGAIEWAWAVEGPNLGQYQRKAVNV